VREEDAIKRTENLIRRVPTSHIIVALDIVKPLWESTIELWCREYLRESGCCNLLDRWPSMSAYFVDALAELGTLDKK